VDEWKGDLAFADVFGETLLLGILCEYVSFGNCVCGTMGLAYLCALKIHVVVAGLEETTDKFHEESDIETPVLGGFASH
jgi:hypothetical protein